MTQLLHQWALQLFYHSCSNFNLPVESYWRAGFNLRGATHHPPSILLLGRYNIRESRRLLKSTPKNREFYVENCEEILNKDDFYNLGMRGENSLLYNIWVKYSSLYIVCNQRTIDLYFAIISCHWQHSTRFWGCIRENTMIGHVKACRERKITNVHVCIVSRRNRQAIQQLMVCDRKFGVLLFVRVLSFYQSAYIPTFLSW